MASANTLLELDQAGFLEPFDWVGNFSSEFPDIKEAAVDRVPSELKGKWVVIYDATRSWVFNTQQLKLSEVPDSIEALTEPKWSRKFAMNASGGSPFDLFGLVWGEERTLAIVKKLMANRPIFKKGTPAVNNAVAGGEAPLGLGSIHETERLKSKGAPVEWKTYGEYIPVLSQGYSVTKKSPQPNLGRLFIAWLAMDGMKLYEELEYTTRATRKESALYKIIKERAPNAKLLEPSNEKEFKLYEAVNDKLEKLLATATAGR
jgi:iron(III) transport system substrate-binding protein